MAIRAGERAADEIVGRYRKIDMLSVVVPCFNEALNLEEVIDRVLDVDIGIRKEIILVDDGSTDGTTRLVRKLRRKYPREITDAVFHVRNMGKCQAVKDGILRTRGDVVIVQDADLECNPKDYVKMLEAINDGRGDVVLGVRDFEKMGRTARVANRMMSRYSSLLSGFRVSDVHCCYMMFPGDYIRKVVPNLKSRGFGFNPEIVARVVRDRDRLRICEVGGIEYSGRTRAEGKKLRVRDGVMALWYITRFNLVKKCR
jgi:glycosyltransferase involved in cell wall biosynthesis